MSKSEKQEFIAKYIESIVIDKDKDSKSYTVQNVNLRSRFLKEGEKILKTGAIEFVTPTYDMKDVVVMKSVKRVTEKERDEYVEYLKEKYDIKVYEDYQDWTYASYKTDDNSGIMRVPNGLDNENTIREFIVDNNKDFPRLDKNGKQRGKHTIITYEKKETPKVNHIGNYKEHTLHKKKSKIRTSELATC